MNIWIVFGGWDYEGDHVCALFTNPIAAFKYAYRLKLRKNFDYIFCEEWPVDKKELHP